MARGSVYRRNEYHCRTCKVRQTREAQLACQLAGHTIEKRQSKIWWFKYVNHSGRVYDESSGSTRKGDAIAKLQDRVGAIADGQDVTPRKGKVTFDEAAADLLADYRVNGKRSIDAVQRRIKLHLAPVFGGWRMIAITPSAIRKFIDQRQQAKASNGQINLELANLKRMFTLAVQGGKLADKPYIAMLREDNVRTGFFEPEQLVSLVAHLPKEIQPVIKFAAITGWRIQSEVLPLQWRNVDFAAGEVRLDAGTTKNREARTFPFTDDLRVVLLAQKVEHDALAKAGHIVPWVFSRGTAQVGSFRRVWISACKDAGCPGRIPHDLRRTAVRNLVRAGIPERVAMTMTGHKTRSVFERYNIVSDGDLKDAARKLDAVGR